MEPNHPSEMQSREIDPGLTKSTARGKPWIGAYMLSQTMFCHRAGLLTHEMG